MYDGLLQVSFIKPEKEESIRIQRVYLKDKSP